MNEDSIFLEALEKDSPDARAAFLNKVCAGNARLRDSVEGLLKAHERANDVLGCKAQGLPATAPPSVNEGIGTNIGPYKLLQQIGEGGMGIVYMDDQEQQVRRSIALEIIKAGMDRRNVSGSLEDGRR